MEHKFQKGFTLLTLGWSDGYSFIPTGFNLLSSASESNRNKKSECLYLLGTDTSLNNAEIVRIYGNRWSIECFFKASKSFLKLSSEFQSRSYGAMVSHTTIVFTRYIILEWIRRNQNDQIGIIMIGIGWYKKSKSDKKVFQYIEQLKNIDMN